MITGEWLIDQNDEIYTEINKLDGISEMEGCEIEEIATNKLADRINKEIERQERLEHTNDVHNVATYYQEE